MRSGGCPCLACPSACPASSPILPCHLGAAVRRKKEQYLLQRTSHGACAYSLYLSSYLPYTPCLLHCLLVLFSSLVVNSVSHLTCIASRHLAAYAAAKNGSRRIACYGTFSEDKVRMVCERARSAPGSASAAARGIRKERHSGSVLTLGSSGLFASRFATLSLRRAAFSWRLSACLPTHGSAPGFWFEGRKEKILARARVAGFHAFYTVLCCVVAALYSLTVGNAFWIILLPFLHGFTFSVLCGSSPSRCGSFMAAGGGELPRRATRKRVLLRCCTRGAAAAIATRWNLVLFFSVAVRC